MPLTLHHLEKSRSHRILWLFEELGVDYEMKIYRRDEAFRADPALRGVHPLGKSPVVTDDGVVLAETGAIIEEVLERFGKGRLVPEPGSPAHTQYRYFLHYAEGSLMPPLLVRLIFDRIGHAKVPFFLKPVVRRIVDQVEDNYTRPEIGTHSRFLDGTLADREWFAGDEFTAADIQMSYPVSALLQRGCPAEDESHRLREWLQRIRARPAFQRALEKGGEMM
jgi:glutathione S-transferase